jgi:hypothetical protein
LSPIRAVFLDGSRRVCQTDSEAIDAVLHRRTVRRKKDSAGVGASSSVFTSSICDLNAWRLNKKEAPTTIVEAPRPRPLPVRGTKPRRCQTHPDWLDVGNSDAQHKNAESFGGSVMAITESRLRLDNSSCESFRRKCHVQAKRYSSHRGCMARFRVRYIDARVICVRWLSLP